MSFAFGFAGDDIESDDEAGYLTDSLAKINIEQSPPSIVPKRHSLQDLLSSLPSQISYNYLDIPERSDTSHEPSNGNFPSASTVSVPRRSIFDIRTQLMAEANPEENDNDNLLAGLERGDLSSGVYEGGFKTWECAVDLASLVASVDIGQDIHVIELGAGSAIPSLVLLQRALRNQHRAGRIHFTLCDYNEDVLRLATAPNVFLAQQRSHTEDVRVNDEDGQELDDIDADTITETEKAFDASSVSFSFISGGWSDEMIELIGTSAVSTRSNITTLILASETIYSPTSTKDFTNVLMKLLQQNSKTSKAWVAAKKIYFGVGGGVEDFRSEVLNNGGNIETILDVRDAGVARVVLEVTAE